MSQAPVSYYPQPWTIRLLLAALLLFGSEILIWTNPTGRSPLDWLLLLPGYIALSALLLDMIARYRVRDWFGALVVSGFYSLLASLILNPDTVFSDMPRTFITRVMGAHALLSLEMLGLFLALTGGDQPRSHRFLVIGSLIVGLAWGIWVRWWPVEEGFGEISLLTMLVYGGVGLAAVLALLALSRRATPLTPDDLRLSPRSGSVVLVIAAALLAVRWFQAALPAEPVVIVALLLTLCFSIIWFRGRSKGRSLLDGHVPVVLLPRSSLLVMIGLFFATAIAGYSLPRLQIAGFDQLALIGIGFTAYGVAWLPTVSLILGVQAYLRQLQKRQL